MCDSTRVRIQETMSTLHRPNLRGVTQVGRVTPFVDPLPVPSRLTDTPVNPLLPLGPRYYQYGTPAYYVLREQEAFHQFHRYLPPTLMWT